MRALLVVALLGTALAAQSGPAGTSYYTRLDATVACGGATTADAMPGLKAEGFKTIVNLRLASEQGADIEASRRAAGAAGLKYVHLPFDSSHPTPALVDAFLAIVKNTANQPIYLHCGRANRASALWLVKRVMIDGWPLQRAITEAEYAGLSSPSLRAFVLDYLKSHGKA